MGLSRAAKSSTSFLAQADAGILAVLAPLQAWPAECRALSHSACLLYGHGQLRDGIFR